MKKHWTQTRAGKKRISLLSKARWAAKRNGSTPPHHEAEDEFQLMSQVITLFGKLPERGKEYIKQRIGS